MIRLDSGQLDPRSVEADQRNIKAGSLQRLGLGPERVFVIAGFAEQVVRVDKRPALFLGEILDRHGWYFGPAFRLGCQQPAVSVDHPVLAVDADRDNHAELAEGSPQLFDLLRWVELGVVFIRMELRDLPQFHLGNCSHVLLLDIVFAIWSAVRVRGPRASCAET